MFRLRITGDLGFEVWQDIPEYEGLYQASTLGRVRSVDRYVNHPSGHKRLIKGRILKLFITIHGYYNIHLSNKESHPKSVHRLVAQAFIPNPNHYPEINHKDENKLSNLVSNLEWCDKSYNVNYGTRNERTANKISKQVLQYDLNGNLIAIHKSAKDVKMKMGFNAGNIGCCCKGERKTAHGYIWKYAD